MGFPLPDTGSVTEDTGVVGGFLTATGDADFGPFFNGDSGLWTAETITGLYGSALTINSDGEWTYTADNANATIQALNTGQTLTEVFTITSTRGTTTVTITINGQDEPPCFVAGTLIDTPYGPRPVETLQRGDEIITKDHGVQKLSWTGGRSINLTAPDARKFRPIRLRKGCFGPGVPERDVLVSPMHRVMVRDPMIQLLFGREEMFCAAKGLINGQTIVWENVPDVSYHHMLFDSHQIVRSSGCESESFYPGSVGLDAFQDSARQEVLELFPELRTLPGAYGQTARVVAKRYEALMLSEIFKPKQDFLETLRRCAA